MQGLPRVNVDAAVRRQREGLAYGLAAYGWWGMVPLYFKLLRQVPPLEMLAHRIVWSVVFLVALIVASRRWRDVGTALQSGGTLGLFLASTVLIAINWYVYVYGVITAQLLQCSLGYFMLPLLSVALGVLALGERLRPWQVIALLFAALGVVVQLAAAGEWPWIAVTLALTFGMYGLLRKRLGVNGLIGLTIETLFLLPIALLYLSYLGIQQIGVFGTHDRTLDGLLLLSGVVTAVPLICFGQAARLLPLTILGFLQYLSPLVQLIIAVAWFDEPFPWWKQASFGLIWLALAIFTVDATHAYRRRVLEALGE